MTDLKDIRKKIEPSEEAIQKTIMSWVRMHKLDDFVIHIPNEGKRTPSYGAKLRMMGMLKGASDLFIALPKGRFHGAWIEIKAKGGRMSRSQERFQDNMRSVGYYTSLCFGLDETLAAVKKYINMKE